MYYSSLLGRKKNEVYHIYNFLLNCLYPKIWKRSMATPQSKATEYTESKDYRAIRISCVLDPKKP